MRTARITRDTAETKIAIDLCLDGKGTLTAGGERYDVTRADGYYLPAGLGKVELDGNMTVLVARMG